MSCEKTCDLPKNLIKGFRLPLFPQKSIIFASMNQASGFIFSPTGDATDAFADYPQLKRVVLPDNPQLHMMKHIFDGSPGLESLCFRSKEPPKLGNAIWTVTMEDVFDASALKRIRLYVPMGSREAYHRSPWGKFAQIEEYR